MDLKQKKSALGTSVFIFHQNADWKSSRIISREKIETDFAQIGETFIDRKTLRLFSTYVLCDLNTAI